MTNEKFNHNNPGNIFFRGAARGKCKNILTINSFILKDMTMLRKITIAAIYLIAALAVLSVAFDAKAEFWGNYSKYKKQNHTGQSYYLMGALDTLTRFDKSDPDDVESWKAGIEDCTLNLGMTGSMLNELVTQKYKEDPKTWGISPYNILRLSLNELCVEDINRHR